MPAPSILAHLRSSPVLTPYLQNLASGLTSMTSVPPDASVLSLLHAQRSALSRSLQEIRAARARLSSFLGGDHSAALSLAAAEAALHAELAAFDVALSRDLDNAQAREGR